MDCTIRKRNFFVRRDTSPYPYNDIVIDTVYRTGYKERTICHLGEDESYLKIGKDIISEESIEKFNEWVEIYFGTSLNALKGYVGI